MVRKEIEVKFYCTKEGRCVRGGQCKTTNYPMEADTKNGKRYGNPIGEKYYICPYLEIVKE